MHRLVIPYIVLKAHSFTSLFPVIEERRSKKESNEPMMLKHLSGEKIEIAKKEAPLVR